MRQPPYPRPVWLKPLLLQILKPASFSGAFSLHLPLLSSVLLDPLTSFHFRLKHEVIPHWASEGSFFAQSSPAQSPPVIPQCPWDRVPPLSLQGLLSINTMIRPFRVRPSPDPAISFSRKCVLVAQWCPTLCYHMDCSLPGACPWDSPGKNTGVGGLFLCQGIFPTQGLNQHLLRLLHCPPQGGDTRNLPPANSSDLCLLGPHSSWDHVVSVGTLQIVPRGSIPGRTPLPLVSNFWGSIWIPFILNVQTANAPPCSSPTQNKGLMESRL